MTPKAQKIKNIDKEIVLNKPNSARFPIVGIGASAGGLEALEQFFKIMPNENGMAFVVIQHLDPNHIGMMPELLQRTTTMMVLQATDGLTVKPNHVYVIPPNKSMSILNDVLHLFVPIESRGLRLPIDYFLSSLAVDRQETGVGIILSGMGSDGSLGLKAIKEKNGFTLVQAPEDSKFDGMPRSALDAVEVDIIALVSELPLKLIALLKHKRVIKSGIEGELISNQNLDKIIILIRTQTGHDFSMYKKNTLFRRIERRMAAHQITKLANYVRFLQENSNELDILFKEMLIGVTSFFRDADVWQMLKDKIFPELFEQLPSGHVFRAWIAACSTGEEAYTLAIVFKEALEKDNSNKNFSLQIFATDIDKDAIEMARKAVFSKNITEDVSPKRLSNFFTAIDDEFRVNTAIREMIIFAPHNVIKDPPFTKLDFISCRNLLIYIEPELQRKLMALFYYSLNLSGVMLLGNAENENSLHANFTIIDSKLKFYKRSILPNTNELLDFPSSYYHKKINTLDAVKTDKVVDNFQSLAEGLILQRFAPASVLINDKGDILYITGRTGKYLEPAAGKANMNIYGMARKGLDAHLMSAIRKAKQNYEPQILRNLKVGTNGGTQYVDVTIQHIETPDAIKGTLMVVFSDVLTTPITEISLEKPTTDIPQRELEIELQRANEDLQSTREEMHTSQEELISTNEELQSSNEELQSTNEELTTSKEEMQSLNEELQTVNVEMQSKISDFIQANNDMKNLLNSTDIATLFLDKELNIRRFTDQITSIIKLRPSDIGRPFTEMVNSLEYPKIEDDAKKVLRTLIVNETIIPASDAKWFTVRIMPYRTHDDRIDGLVITFIDISVAKKLEEKLAAANTDQREASETELRMANNELIVKNKEMEKLANEVALTNTKITFQYKEIENIKEELAKATSLLKKHNL